MTTQTMPWKKHHLKQEGAGYTVFTLFNTLFLLLVIYITAYPVYYVVVASLSDATAMAKSNSALLWPMPPASLTIRSNTP